MRLGPASETLDTLAAEGKRFDLAFLDADKTGYLGYYKKVPPTSEFPVTDVVLREASLCLHGNFWFGDAHCVPRRPSWGHQLYSGLTLNWVLCS